ncbi:MAG: FixH family protein [Wenzhouxiangella sp.]
MQQSDINPWYREPWPWIILGLLGLGVVAGSTLALIALSSPPEMVTGEYERLGRGITDMRSRTESARALGLTGVVVVEPGQVSLSLEADDVSSLPESLLVLFQHPAVQDRDSILRLQQKEHGQYAAVLEALPHERAHVIVTDLAQTWWLAGRMSGDEPVELVPKRL